MEPSDFERGHRLFETGNIIPLCQIAGMHTWNRRASASLRARGASRPGQGSFSAICILSVLAGIVLLVELRTCIRVRRLLVSDTNQHQQEGDHDELQFKRPSASSGLFLEDDAEIKRRRGEWRAVSCGLRVDTSTRYDYSNWLNYLPIINNSCSSSSTNKIHMFRRT